MKKKTSCLLVSFVVGFAACGKSDDKATEPAANVACSETLAVELKNFQFSPQCIAIAKGATVVFTNADAAAHTVRGNGTDSDAFDSGNLAGGATFNHTFAGSAQVDISCDYHPAMQLTVQVK